ncbi:hypothetical protein ACHAXA_000988 [Cyclostephanos tholiformis]|uniref:Major facilitator superfamily (MFS) profile domain-containing protein n=1 Tax=Cyclostephanos tholiformis TaxID=382380 RepID=A0ABD3SEB5_9STRA
MFSEEFDVDNTDDPSSVKQAEYLAASIFFGMLIGGTFLGFLSDHIGRRPALLAVDRVEVFRRNRHRRDRPVLV